jgi:hypothetical protein
MTLVCTKFGFLKQPGSNVCTCVSFHTGANCSISGAVLLSDEVHVFNILFMLVNCFVMGVCLYEVVVNYLRGMYLKTKWMGSRFIFTSLIAASSLRLCLHTIYATQSTDSLQPANMYEIPSNFLFKVLYTAPLFLWFSCGFKLVRIHASFFSQFDL